MKDFFKNLTNDDFKEFMALYTITLSYAYMFLITFTVIPKENQRFADIILGSLLTIVIGKVLSEYFSPKPDKEAKAKETAKSENENIESDPS